MPLRRALPPAAGPSAGPSPVPAAAPGRRFARSPWRPAFAAISIAASACSAWAGAGFEAVRQEFRPSDTRILDRDGALLHRLRSDAGVRRGRWVALEDMSPALRAAMVLSEDRRFWEHGGVDWQAVPAAAWANLWNRRTRGASTITMQLVGLLDEDLRRGDAGRGVAQKVGQAVSARRLEQDGWRKDQILEAYLNLVPFRGELVGIDALSRTLFGKAAHGLDAREAAVAAALVRAPNAGAARVARRACEVLRALEPGRAPDCAGLDLFAAAALQRRAYEASEGIAPHLARQALRQAAAAARPGRTADAEVPPPGPGAAAAGAGAADAARAAAAAARAAGDAGAVAVAGGGMGTVAGTGTGAGAGAAQPAPAPAAPAEIRTTLSAPLQRFAAQSLQRHLRELRGRQVEDGAAVVLDNATGAVLAWVGSSGALSRASEVDGVLALRQPGSTLKPFLYAEALAERRITAASLIDDSPEQIATASGLYIPQNYDRRFKGWVSARTALASSLNVPAVRTLAMVSPDAFFRQLRAAGLPLRESGGYYGYSLALGSAEVTLLDLANAYRTLANGGRAGAVRLLADAAADAAAGPAPARPRGGGARGAAAQGSPGAPSGPAIDPGAAFIVGDILADGNARAPTFGTDSVLATRFWTAVKTGTSKDMRDNWAVGWSQRYTVGVWVGNASGAPMRDVSGVSGAAPVWADLMHRLHAEAPSRAPAPPAGLVRARVDFGAQREASREEWFLPGTQQAVFALQGDPSLPAAAAPGGAARRAAVRAGAAARPASGAVGTAAAAPGGAAARIASPAGGTILALDPDIPPAHQRLLLAASVGAADPAGRSLRWEVDGRPLGRGARAHWMPWPGRHRLQLRDAQGRPLDEVQVEVRGAGVRVQAPASGR
jgi:penicillin-binding protein 1C